ncbi:MAG: hypothetical protein WCS43_13990 [Verrucomicrobiota bacterium]
MSETTTSTIERITCPCGTVFEWDNTASHLLGGKWADIFRPKHCETCQDAIDRKNEKENRERSEREAAEKITASIQRLNDKLAGRTPARYRDTDIQHAGFNRKLWNRVKVWRPTSEIPWLGLVGESGASKTRIQYLLLREIMIESIDGKGHSPLSFEIATAYELSEAVRNQYSKRRPEGHSFNDDSTEGERSRAYLDRMATAGILLLDDLGKAKNTPAVASELFAIIDRRHAENLPMVWTANSPPEQIVSGMSPDMAGPLAGRLIECSTIIPT